MALGSITIDLLLKTGAFNNDAKVAEKRLKDLGEQARKYGRIVGTAAVAAATGLAALIQNNIRTMDTVSKMAQQIGVATEDLTSMRYAAEQMANVTAGQFDMALRRMTRRIAEAADGGGPAAKAIEAMGLSAQELARLSPDEQFRRIADGIKGASDQGTRLRHVMALMDTEGMPLVNMLKQGAAGIKEFEEEAARLGITLSTEAGKQAEEFQTNLTRLKTAAQGLGQTVAADLLPDLVKLVEQLTEVSDKAGSVESAATRIADAIRGIATAISTVVTVGEGFRTLLVELQNQGVDYMRLFSPSVGKDGLTYDPMGAWERIKASGSRVEAAFAQITNPIDPFRGVTSDVTSTVLDRQKKEAEEAAEAARKAQAAAAEAARNAQANAKARAEAERVATEAMRESERALEEYMQAQIAFEERQLAWMTRIEDATAMMEGPASRAVLTLKRSIAEADAALAAGTITIAQHSDYVAAMGHQYGETLGQVDVASGEMSAIADQAARNMQDAFADFLFDPFEDGLKGMAKSFAETLQRLAAQAAASEIFKAIGTWASGYTGAGSGWINAIGGILDGKRATGGPVYPGGTFLVGENGPEVLRMGNNSGTIVPNNRLPSLGNGAVSVKVEMINQGGQVETQSQTAQRMPDGTVLVRLVNQVVNQGIARGDYNAAMGHAFGLQRRPIPQG